VLASDWRDHWDTTIGISPPTKPKGVESSETEMCSATEELSKAMTSARAFVDDHKPSQLPDDKKHWDQGRAWWNQTVLAIWLAAKQGAASPIIEHAPTARPVT
jgi:hypothetical protein